MESSNEYAPHETIGDKNWSIWIQGEKIIKDVRRHLIDHIQGANIKKHISKTTNIAHETVNEIDWDMTERASKKMAIARRIWLLKHVSGFAPTASKMYHRNEWGDDLCPQCQLCRETTNHIYECANIDATAIRTKGIIRLKQKVESSDTAPAITECLCLSLIAGSSCTFREMTRSMDNEDELLQKIMMQQTLKIESVGITSVKERFQKNGD